MNKVKFYEPMEPVCSSGTNMVKGCASWRVPTLLVKPRVLLSPPQVWFSANSTLFSLMGLDLGAFVLKILFGGFVSETSHFPGRLGFSLFPWGEPPYGFRQSKMHLSFISGPQHGALLPTSGGLLAMSGHIFGWHDCVCYYHLVPGGLGVANHPTV